MERGGQTRLENTTKQSAKHDKEKHQTIPVQIDKAMRPAFVLPRLVTNYE